MSILKRDNDAFLSCLWSNIKYRNINVTFHYVFIFSASVTMIYKLLLLCEIVKKAMLPCQSSGSRAIIPGPRFPYTQCVIKGQGRLSSRDN